MPKNKNQKMKIIYLAKIFYERTDYEHHLRLKEITDLLLEYGIKASRESLYDDIKLLIDFGMDINKDRNGSTTEYFLGSREFEISELRLLSDVIYSSRFITAKKTKELTEKIKKMTSVYNADERNGQIMVLSSIFENVPK